MKWNLACMMVVTVVLCQGDWVDASPSVGSRQVSEPVPLVLKGARGNFEIPVREGVETYIEFPSDIRSWTVASQRMLRKYGIERKDVRLRIRPRRKLKKGDRLNIYVESAKANVNLLTRRAESPEEAARIYIITPLSEEERRKAAIAAGIERREQEIRAQERKETRAEYERRLHRLQQEHDQKDMKAAKDALLSDAWLPVADRCGNGPLCATPLRGRYIGERFYIALQLENHELAPHDVAEIEVRSADGKRMKLAGVDMDTSDAVEDGRLASLPPRERTRGLIAVEPGDASLEDLTVIGRGPDGALAFMSHVKDWKEGQTYIPITEEEVRERAAKGRVSLHLQALGGAIWLGDGIGTELTEATSLKGLGARVTYGFNRYIAFEADVIGATSGDAQFGDVMWEGMQGDLVRNTALGRVQLGGVLRFGYEYIPVVRLGLGLLGASHDAEFTPVGGATLEPDVGFEFSTVLNFGAGLDIRLGDHFVAGLLASVNRTSNLSGEGSAGSIEAGIHLGYGWNP